MDESPNQRAERHKAHQEMLERHKRDKDLARERHRANWHKIKTPAITLV